MPEYSQYYILSTEKDTEYCEQQYDKYKDKNEWQAVGMGILGAVTLFTIPILGIAAAGAAGAMGEDEKDTVVKSKQHVSYVSDRNIILFQGCNHLYHLSNDYNHLATLGKKLRSFVCKQLAL